MKPLYLPCVPRLHGQCVLPPPGARPHSAAAAAGSSAVPGSAHPSPGPRVDSADREEPSQAESVQMGTWRDTSLGQYLFIHSPTSCLSASFLLNFCRWLVVKINFQVPKTERENLRKKKA